MKSGKRLAENAMKWLMRAQRPLNADEFLDAIPLESGGNRISLSPIQLLDMCCDLVILDRDSNIFRFAHLSVQEYLEDRAGYSQTDVNPLAAERCLAEFIHSLQMSFSPHQKLHHPM